MQLGATAYLRVVTLGAGLLRYILVKHSRVFVGRIS